MTFAHTPAVVAAGAELDHKTQDLPENEVPGGRKKWSVLNSLNLIVFSSIGLWALIFTAYQVIF